MASAGRRIHPTEDMSSQSYNYGGVLLSRISDLEASKSMGMSHVTLEEARWSDMRKRIGLPRLPKRMSSPLDDLEKAREGQVEFIRQHFHMKECKKFVPKPDQKVKIVKDLKCHCGEILYHHFGYRKMARFDMGEDPSFLVPSEYSDLVRNEREKPKEKLPVVPWNAKEDIRFITTNSFGKIAFNIEQIGGTKPAKYVRVADTDSEKDVLQLMLSFWRIMEPVPPKLVISVIGGAKNFKLDGRMRETFSSGLIKAAKTTSAWLITSGFNMGVMKAVGQAVHEGQTFQWDNDRMTHVLRCIGIAPWGYVKGRHFLESSTGKGKFNAHYNTSNTILHGQPVPLNYDHTHFVFVDDGMRNRYGGVADFRARFEKHIMSPQGLGIPVVLVVVEGGQDAIMDAHTSLKHGIPVVVCSGTGRAADILSYAYSHTIKKPSGERTMKEKHIHTLGVKLYMAYGKSWGKRAEEETIKYQGIVQDCCKHEDKIIIFHINKHEDLDLAILGVLLKAEGAGKATDHRMNQLKLALTWNRADIAQEEIFREDVNWEQGHLDEAMTMALDQDKVDFVKLILKEGIIMKKYLTVQKLEKLYSSTADNPKHMYLFFMLQRSSKKDQFVLGDIGLFLTQLLDKYDDEQFSENDGKKIPVVQQSSSFKKRVMFNETTDTDDEDANCFVRPYKQLLIWAVLMNRVELAMFFWEMGEEPIASAISVTKLCRGMIKKLPKYQTRLREEFEQMKILFEKLAIKVLDECHSVDPEKAMMLVERKSHLWSKMSCLQVSASAEDQAFLSSVTCQNSINTTWKHGILSSWRYVLMAIIFPPCIYFVEVARLGEKKLSVLQKILTFYTAPMTKFGSYTIAYVIFLCLFSYLVLVDFKASPTPAEWACVLWILSFLCTEIHTFLAFPIPTWKGKFRDWFRLPNVLDVSNLVLFFLGFGLRWFPEYFFAAKMIYCFNTVIFYLRILKVYTANSKLGPKLIMIRRMLEELLLFMMVLVVFLLAYGVAHQGLLYAQRVRSYNIFIDIIYYPYWQLYGELFLDEIQTDAECVAALSSTESVLTPYNNTCRTHNWMVPVLLSIYLVVGNILLLNLLIAIFSHVFDTVEENSMMIWKFQMYFLVMEYDIKSTIIPPFNLTKHVYLLFKWIFRKTCCKKETEGIQYLQHHLMYLQLFEKEMMANYLRTEKAGSSNTLDAKVNKLQKRVDELTKIIEDELIAEQHTFGMEGTALGMETMQMQAQAQPPLPPPKKPTRWPSVKQVLALRDHEELLNEGSYINKLFGDDMGAEVQDAQSLENNLEVPKSKFEDIVMDEVKKKHKKKKSKKDKKKREKHVEEKELNINLAEYDPKPDYSYKTLDTDSSPTRGRPPSVTRIFLPPSPRASFLQSRAEALPWSDSEDDSLTHKLRKRSPLNIQTSSLPRQLQSDLSEDDNYARGTQSSRLIANRRMRREERKRIMALEERLGELERERVSESYDRHARNRKKNR